ncbi:flagellar protein FliT [Aliidiomarina indica]|uniref:flagellar protein FliT n=1 Tax=Aliidiomarina indica TaxID=2749147 RepID=UPI00188E35BD|nr:flagellar protein FliT [Aliidiomarina indica]
MGARAYLKPVMDGEEVLASYRRLLGFSETMLFHARQDDWTSLIDSEVKYVSEVDRLQKYEMEAMLSEDQQEAKLELLEKLLEQDREIRERLAQRRAELEKLLTGASQKKKVDKAYRTS